MIPRRHYELPPEMERLEGRAVRLEWATIAALMVIIASMYAVMGSSQAMKTAWAEDILSLVPPISYLIAVRLRNRAPTELFPYGYHRALSIAFLCGSLALFTMGALLLGESVVKLVTEERPTIGSMKIFGELVWQGYPMMAVLALSIIPSFVLGRMKLPLGRDLHDKALHADADMNKADWLTGASAILGIVGVGYGLWWADAVAAAFISLQIVRDGAKNLTRVVKDLMDRAPTTVVSDEPDPIRWRLARELEGLGWVDRAGARLREEGHVVSGELFVVPKSDHALVRCIDEATDVARSLDWRVCDVVVTLVSAIPPTQRPSEGTDSVKR